MTRKKKLFAVAIALPVAIALGVGLRARRASSDTLSPDLCDKDLSAVFERCEVGGVICEKTSEGLEDACQAGCVRLHCPNYVSCTELDPIWCKPCEDESGALHWKNLFEVYDLCDRMVPFQGSMRSINENYDCIVREGEQRCPALANFPQWWLPPSKRKAANSSSTPISPP